MLSLLKVTSYSKLSQVAPNLVSPSPNTSLKPTYTTTPSKDHNLLPDAQHQHTPFGPTQLLPEELLSDSSHVSNTFRTAPSTSAPPIIPQSPSMSVEPICQLYATFSQSSELPIGTLTKSSKSFSPSFHTHNNQAPLLVNNHPMFSRKKNQEIQT